MDQESIKQQVQRSASGYLNSSIHASGDDLTWMATEVKADPPPALALDLATGAGHTAFMLSRYCRQVIGYDLTREMLDIAAEEARRRGIDNITWLQGDAEMLPFSNRRFDWVTCRIAAHHFPRPEQAFAEVHRVLAPQGRFILIDNTTPANADSDQVLNEVERLRDPSHQQVWPVPGWTRLLKAAGFTSIHHLRSWETPVQWKQWMDRAQTPDPARRKARQLLLHSPESVQQALGFTPSEDDPVLVLRKSMWICRK